MAFFDFFNRSNRRGERGGSDAARSAESADSSSSSSKESSVRNAFNQTVKRDLENLIARGSVIDSYDKQSFRMMVPAFATLVDGMQALPVPSNKPDRLAQYRQIANFDECAFCIEEIADDFLHDNESGDFIRLSLDEGNKHKFNATQEEVLQNEFQKFISLFDFRNNGFQYMKQFVIEGEVAWENIINPKLPELGIIGVKKLQNDFYDILIDDTARKIGIVFNKRALQDHVREIISPGYYSSTPAFGSLVNNGYNIYNSYNKDESAVMLWPQVTYVSYSDTSSDDLIVYPLIEKCKQPYYQLALLEDSAVILRVTRAPERLLFNIDTGGMPDRQAEEYVRRFGNDLKQKKVALPGANNGASGVPNTGMRNAYNPSTMLESWIFAKSEANGGTTVSTVGSSAAYDQIEDIKFFTKKLFKSFKVPWSRFETPSGEHKNDDSISYEEYGFSRQSIRLQRLFARGLTNSFKTHLRLRGIWDEYGISEKDFSISFTPPVLYDIFHIQRLQEFRMGAYASLADREEMSKIMAMKKVLHWTDAEIQENYENLNKEAILNSTVQYYAGKVEEGGPNAAARDLVMNELKPEKSTYERMNRTKNLTDSIEFNDLENDPDEQIVEPEESRMGGEAGGAGEGEMPPGMGGEAEEGLGGEMEEGPGGTGQDAAFGMGGGGEEDLGGPEEDLGMEEELPPP